MLIQEREIQKVSNEMVNMLNEDKLELINELHDAVLARDIEKIDELFTQLLEESEVYFKTLEEIMEKDGHANLQMYIKDHNMMREKLQQFHHRWGILKSPKEVKSFLEKDYKKMVLQHASRWDAGASEQL